MLTHKCPVCGGTLIWDYESGEVVCSKCGLVVDKIYDYGVSREREDVVEWREVKLKTYPKKNHILKKYKYHIRLYNTAQNIVKNKPWLEIDYSKILETGKMIKTIKSIATIKAEKNITEKNLWDKVEKGIEYIEKTHPATLARSDRGKYALAYMIYYYIQKTKFPPQKEITEIFNISETSYKRLLKTAKKIISLKPAIYNK
ncbi:TFIIB-type zinc ribbon-containing protein [Staphylothermus marinus]|uniref:TFIIB-type zinc ribbon-containing protein n=1 Tax=Staphylothermus marinus TaxID=2280 RepID=UPI001FCB0FE6|nr:TFIIB-type zinc ribbon-containing protein [Staphylothermus marinus]